MFLRVVIMIVNVGVVQTPVRKICVEMLFANSMVVLFKIDQFGACEVMLGQCPEFRLLAQPAIMAHDDVCYGHAAAHNIDAGSNSSILVRANFLLDHRVESTKCGQNGRTDSHTIFYFVLG